ncbi:MAG: response regulator, partial [Methanomassiliicoccales archaeon]|nr:response regulator [Methanomassiliicoccales archaeon]
MTGPEIKLLVLEDNPSDFELMKRELKKGSQSHVIEWAQGKADFEWALEKERPDLILLDYNLPGFGGLAGLRLARSRYPDVPAIIVSGAIGEEVAIEALKAGATDYVLKQRLERLRPVVERALEEAKQLARRRLVENELEETKKRLEAIVGQMPMGLFIIDTKSDATILINEEAGALFHLDQLNPGNTRDLHHSVKIFDPEFCPPGLNLTFIDEAIRRGDVIRSAVKLIERQDGSRFYARFNIAPVRDANGNEIAVVMMVRDVSEQVESERALARSNKELQDFAYVASHDLQEPLRMVVSYLSLLEMKYGTILDAKGHEYIHFAVDGGERMRELIDDLLEYSRV